MRVSLQSVANSIAVGDQVSAYTDDWKFAGPCPGTMVMDPNTGVCGSPTTGMYNDLRKAYQDLLGESSGSDSGSGPGTCPLGVEVPTNCVCPDGYELNMSTRKCASTGIGGLFTPTNILIGGVVIAALILLSSRKG